MLEETDGVGATSSKKTVHRQTINMETFKSNFGQCFILGEGYINEVYVMPTKSIDHKYTTLFKYIIIKYL